MLTFKDKDLFYLLNKDLYVSTGVVRALGYPCLWVLVCTVVCAGSVERKKGTRELPLVYNYGLWEAKCAVQVLLISFLGYTMG